LRAEEGEEAGAEDPEAAEEAERVEMPTASIRARAGAIKADFFIKGSS
jgi:hypothetical protein